MPRDNAGGIGISEGAPETVHLLSSPFVIWAPHTGACCAVSGACCLKFQRPGPQHCPTQCYIVTCHHVVVLLQKKQIAPREPPAGTLAITLLHILLQRQLPRNKL